MKFSLKSGFTLYTNDDETMLITKKGTMRNSMNTEELSQFRRNPKQWLKNKKYSKLKIEQSLFFELTSSHF